VSTQSPGELRMLALLDLRELLVGDTDRADEVVVDQAHALADRPHRDLCVAGQAELAHHDDVEGCIQSVRDRRGDWHTAAWDAEHHRPGPRVAERPARGGESASG